MPPTPNATAPLPDRPRFNYVGEPVRFEGYVDDFENGVAAIQLSLDGGATWTDFPTDEASSELGLNWNFTYTPKAAGRYQLKARAVSRSGLPAATVESFAFDVLPQRSATWGSMALRPVGGANLEGARLFRSRELDRVTAEEALTMVNVLGIRSVYDIRGAKEVAVSPEPGLPGVRMFAVQPSDGHRRSNAKQRLVAGVIGEYGAPEERMKANYRRYAVDYPLIGTVLRSIASQGTPALVHCKNGKDRTGVLCAAAMKIAGFSDRDILDDYLLTNSVNAAAIAAEEAELSAGMTDAEHEVLMSFLEARSVYLEAFFDEACRRYGSFEAYVHQGLRLTDDQCASLTEMLGGRPAEG